MGETFRLLGDLTEKYKFNGTVFSPNLDVDIIQHFEYKNDNLIGVSLNGSVIGVLNDVFINRTLSLNYKQDNVEYMLLDERDSIIIFLSNIRIFLFQYTLLVILMVLSLLLVIIIYIRKKRKRGN